MGQEIESQFRAAVEELSRWVTAAPIPHSSKEWRERYLKLEAEVRRLSINQGRVPDKGPKGAANSST